ncbi:MAG: fluoride efflux transporter CrcB [Bacteroidia bacterium]|nr:fluoride efflux transporter CrcB [Bacteroidia bacterium]NNF30315.1 fluoride efflux transporter CrcB [Flavobacteriaceae bacterium]MBT8276391.1 fluoride efflux transporter CrcB [Bacteroidia bacterium]NNJ80990.1 fluoride efflux transporter CrcB [Flavobacteriaceae bacterium]NNK53540.1 fluoride efflux transporter CrcB [Flavobacteriaceae bacterium]
MKHVLLVFLGGGLGSALRYAIGKWLDGIYLQFPAGTFVVNIVGSLVIGVVLGMALKNTSISQNILLFTATGFCGGFTTFSAFAYENYALLKNEDFLSFSLYTFGSLALGFGAVVLGIWLSRLI